MARSKSSSSNIYSQHDHRDAIDIADRGVRGEFVHPSDAFGIVPSTPSVIPYVMAVVILRMLLLTLTGQAALMS